MLKLEPIEKKIPSGSFVSRRYRNMHRLDQMPIQRVWHLAYGTVSRETERGGGKATINYNKLFFTTFFVSSAEERSIAVTLNHFALECVLLLSYIWNTRITASKYRQNVYRRRFQFNFFFRTYRVNVNLTMKYGQFSSLLLLIRHISVFVCAFVSS